MSMKRYKPEQIAEAIGKVKIGAMGRLIVRQ
jgi:hypothetical protein